MKNGWETKKLCALYQIGSSKRVLKSQWKTNGVPFYRGREITRLAADGFVDNELFVSEEHFAELSKQTGAPQAGDIVLTAIGTIGNSHVVRDSDRFYFKDASVLWMKRAAEVSSEFVNLWLKSPLFLDQLDRGNGATVDTLTIQKLQSVELRFPPHVEQQRIVGILDEAFEGIATAKANAEKNLQNARALLESHLDSVFIQHGKGWVEKRLGEVAISISTGPFGTMLHKSDYVPDGIPLVNPMNIIDSRIVPSRKMMVNEKTRQRLSGYVLKTGDIVIGRRGELGRCALVTDCEDGWLCGTGSFFVRLSDRMDGTFFVALFGSQQFKARLEGSAVGTTMSSLNHGILNDLRIPVPPINVQRKAMAKANDLLVETKRLESIYKRKLNALEELKKAWLHQAFSGQLTTDRIAIPAPAPVRFLAQLEGISTTDLHAGILGLAHRLHEQAGTLEHFGHVKAEKIAHMIEARLGIDLGRNPMKDAAGPNDFPHLHKVEYRARKANWFDFKQVKGAAYRVHKLRAFDRLIERTRAALGERINDVDGLLELMLPMQTQQAEIFCTVYAAWNNLLLDGNKPTDEQIVFEARENWHPDKLKIPRERFFDAIEWIRNKALAPLGKGKRVSSRVD